MARKQTDANTVDGVNAQPRLHQRAREIQKYGTVNHALPLDLEEPVRLEMTEQLNQLLADTMRLLAEAIALGFSEFSEKVFARSWCRE